MSPDRCAARTVTSTQIGAAAVALVLAGCAGAAWFVALVARRGGVVSGLVAAGAAGFGLGAMAGGLALLFWWAGRTALGPQPERLLLLAGELVLLERVANHMQRFGGRSGVLTATTRRLLFHPRSLNFDRAPLAIDLASIEDARAVGFGQLAVSLGASGQAFTVSDPDDLASLIRQLAAAPEQERSALAVAWREAPVVATESASQK